MTLAEIGDALGITRQSVAEILQKAIRKFTKELEARGYTLEDLV